MSPYPDLTNKKINDWYIIGKSEYKRGFYDCICSCGKHGTVKTYNLINDISKGCRSCYNNHKTHGLSKTKEYRAWSDMKKRCYAEGDIHNFRYYKNIGIYVCENYYLSFESFLKDVGLAPSSNHVLDRIDNDLNYTCGHCPECIEKEQSMNIKWSTPAESNRNKSNIELYYHNGKLLCLTDWAKEYNINYQTLRRRIKIQGLPFLEALTRELYYNKK